MTNDDDLKELDNYELGKLLVDFVRRSALHYGLWFSEVNHQLGLEEALKMEDTVFEQFSPVMLRRLANVLGFELENGLPSGIARMPREKTIKLMDALASNWLSADGLWLQVLEQQHDMLTAKRCNDTCWVRFSPLEAQMIKSLLNLPESGGLDALEMALKYRLYHRINKQTIKKEGNSLVLTMLECRVQEGRKRRGMETYQCKSAGVVEYTNFARAIDNKLKTECVACPPESYRDGFSCSWRFFKGKNK